MPGYIGTGYRRRTEFTPADLGPSLWLEADAVNTLFTTIAGSTTPADGGTVGRWQDRSANGFDLTAAADDGTRPLWNLNSGFSYINFTGTGEAIRRAADLGMYAAGAASVFVAVRGNPGTNTILVSSANSAVNNELYDIVQSNTVTASSASALIRNGAGTQLLANATVLQTGAFDNTDRVYGIIDSGIDVTPYVDGTAGAITTYSRSGTIAPDRFAVGCVFRAAAVAGTFFTGRLYALVIVNRVISEGERRNLERYLGAKMGRPI